MNGPATTSAIGVQRRRRPHPRTLWAAAFAATLLLAACGQRSDPPPGTTASTASTASPAAKPPGSDGNGRTTAAVVVSDDLGRTLRFEQPPRRIVSLVPSSTEIVFALGAGDRLVGVTEYCDYPAEAAKLPKVGGFSANTVSVETIIGLEPDVVLTTGKLHQHLLSELDRLAIPVVALEPELYDDVCENIVLLGRITGQETRGNQIAAAMRAKAREVRQRAASLSEDRRLAVFYQVWHDPLMAATDRSFIGEMINMAGGRNIFHDLNQRSPQVSEEAVLARNPDVILAPSAVDRETLIGRMNQRSGWEEIAALQTGRVHLVPNDLVSRPGPRLADGLQAIAHAIYPELFP